MECSQMLDVLHYYFEEYFVHASAEGAERASVTRETIYQTLYEENYKYALAASSNRSKDFDIDSLETEEYPEGIDGTESLTPFNPRVNSKPYTPPTEMSDDLAAPFGSILDSPLR